MGYSLYAELNKEILIRNFIKSLRDSWNCFDNIQDNEINSGTAKEREIACRAIQILIDNGYIDSKTFLDTEKAGLNEN